MPLSDNNKSEGAKMILGVYYSRNGEVAVEVGSRYPAHTIISESGESRNVDHLEGDWRPLDIPEFGPLPDKPDIPQCLVQHRHNRWSAPCWAEYHKLTKLFYVPARDYDFYPHELVIVEHPRNDRAARELLEGNESRFPKEKDSTEADNAN